MISRHYNDPLAGHFGLDKTQELIARKYYEPTLRHNIEAYVTSCEICLASKSVKHKLYGDLQPLPVSTHWWKDLSMDFVTGLPVLTNWKGEIYDSILVIIDTLMKIVHYEPVKITMNALGLAEIIIEAIVRQYDLTDLFISDCDSVFT